MAIVLYCIVIFPRYYNEKQQQLNTSRILQNELKQNLASMC